MKSLWLILFLMLPIFLLAQESNNSDENSLFEPISETLDNTGIFENEKPLEITLKYDITSFIRHKAKGKYLDAELCLHINETDSVVKDIRLKARGNFRKGHCFFPPIYLNFKTDPIKKTELEGIKKIKLVTHCSSSKVYQTYILREYLAYKLYNVLSENSFRVRLVDIKYIDTGKKGRNYKRMGFMIEPIEALVGRTNSTEINPEVVVGADVGEEAANVVALFNYMIGNTDWRFKGGHNMKYIKALDKVTTKVIPVPYDYDYAGFVGTSYANPQEWTSLKNTRDREYLGYCRTDETDYQKAIDLFVRNKDEILSEIKSFDYLEEKERNSLTRYLEDFYALTQNPKALVNVLKRECRNDDF